MTPDRTTSPSLLPYPAASGRSTSAHARMLCTTRFLPLAAAAAALLAGTAGAQQVARDTARVGAVVVTATRLPTPLGATPATVTVLDGDDLRARGITQLVDALREVPGVALVQSGSFGAAASLFLRGGNSNYTKVLVDGVPLNTPGGSFDIAHLTTDDVERVEVVRGASSVLYGTDAVTGVINVITRRGGATRASLGARGGGYGTREADAQAGGRAGGIAWSLAGAHRATRGVYEFNSDYRNTSIGGSLGAARAAGDVRLSARLTDARYHFPTDFAGVPSDSNQYTDDRRLALALDGGRRLGSAVEARLLASAAELRQAARNDPDGPADVAGSRSRTDSYRRGADARLNVATGPLGTLTLGSAFERQQAEPANAAGPLPPRHRVTVGGYAQLAAARSAVDYVVGARLDENSLFGRFVTGRAAAGWRVAAGTRLRASVGNAYKEPGLDEQFDTPFTTGNPDLDPERVLTWEAGLEQSLAADAVTLRATYFDQRFRDLIQYGFQQGPGGSDYRNVPDATARGIELEARTTALPAGLSLAASYTALRTRAQSAETSAGTYENGARLLRRPTHSGSMTLGWTRTGRARLAAVVNAAATRDDLRFGGAPDFLTTRVALPGYATLDLSSELTVARAGRGVDVVLTTRVENALDKRYEPVVNYRNLGRRALVGVRVGR